MSYEGKHLDQGKTEPRKPKAKDRPSIDEKLVAGTTAGVLILGVFPHAAECVTRDVAGSLFCESKALKRHDLHIETAANSSNTSTGVQIIALVSDTGSPSVADALDLFIRPKSS